MLFFFLMGLAGTQGKPPSLGLTDSEASPSLNLAGIPATSLLIWVMGTEAMSQRERER